MLGVAMEFCKLTYLAKTARNYIALCFQIWQRQEKLHKKAISVLYFHTHSSLTEVAYFTH